ncbi:MAG: VWA domain-containing protein [Pseudomonadota bacterium]
MKHRSTLIAIGVAIALGACSNSSNVAVDDDSQTQSEEVLEAIDVGGTGNYDMPPPVLSEPLVVNDAVAEYEVARQRAVASQSAPQYAKSMVVGDAIGYLPVPPPYGYPPGAENYAEIDTNGVFVTREVPVSTLSIDVDTGSYSNVRSLLNRGQLPPRDAVRVEEMINYFDYDYGVPEKLGTPFSVEREIAPAPWNPDNRLLKIGIKGYVPDDVDEMAANLVFLIDVSGSMASPDKLGLLKTALKQLTGQLDGNDSVSIVVYAGASGVVLPPTSGDNRAEINAALARLQAGGSTNGEAGITLAYEMARQAFKPTGVNRVLLATDGDFNVGTTDLDALKDLIESQRESGIALTTLGFGRGNYNDALMEQLADIGNGNHAYIDTPHEARKVLVDELAATMMTIAKDVKIQIEFNPSVVSEYRLIGYENRLLDREDFNNDKVDAGEIGAGHTVTAIYELTMTDSGKGLIDPLRYQSSSQQKTNQSELGFLKMRYKQPDGDRSQLLTWVIDRDEVSDDLAETSKDMRFAVAVAAFGQRLRGGGHLSEFGFDAIHEMARSARGDDPFGRRAEFAALVRLADALDPASTATVGHNVTD